VQAKAVVRDFTEVRTRGCRYVSILFV